MRIALSQWCGPSIAVLLLVLPAPAPALLLPRQESAAHRKDAVHYKYQYAVDDPVSGVVNDRWEQRSGDFVKGQYSLLDADGMVRIVDYEVDGERGFHAVIRMQHPAPALLSTQAVSQVREVFQDSPVNIRAKAGLGVPNFALQNPRFSSRDNLPFNYHALDAAKLGLLVEDDGGNLQHLDGDLEGALSTREAQRRKYHRENHLLPHERFLEHDQQDQVVQQDTQQDLQSDDNSDYDSVSSERNALDVTSPSGVFNPRAAYIHLHPRPRPLPPLPPPNPAVSSTAPPPVPPPVPPPAPLAPQPLRPDLLRALYGYGLHTLVLAAPRAPRRPQVVQHLTETSPGLSSSRSYYY